MKSQPRVSSALFYILLVGSCQNAPTGTQSKVGAISSSPGGHQIGDSCKHADGWIPAPLPTEPDQTPAGKFVAHKIPAGYIERHNLGPGIAYCLPPTMIYPGGYWTMNCLADTDCPAPARCDGEMCRKPCSKDSDCGSGTTCSGGVEVLRYCMGELPD
jgi:hypothetical protein